MGNTFDSFSALPEKLQVEALREGELRLQAQLTVASAADQRALTWGGLLLTGATASLAGAFALLFKNPPDPALPYLPLLFAAALFVAAWLSIGTVAPKLYCMPGNRPGGWLPHEWDCSGDEAEKIGQARRDQALQLDEAIRDNAEAAGEAAKRMHLSFRIAFFAVLTASFCFLLYLLLGHR